MLLAIFFGVPNKTFIYWGSVIPIKNKGCYFILVIDNEIQPPLLALEYEASSLNLSRILVIVSSYHLTVIQQPM